MNKFNDYRPAHIRSGAHDHNITRASRTANAQWNTGSNRAARRNAARITHMQMTSDASAQS